VVKIAGQTDKKIVRVQLPMLNSTIIGLSGAFSLVWFNVKRLRCMRSIWSISRCSYRTVLSTSVRNSKQTKETPLENFGEITSVSGLRVTGRRLGEIAKKKSVAAGAKIEKGMKKAISFVGTRARKITKTKSSDKKPERDSQVEKPKESIEIEHEIQVETSGVEVSILNTQESDRASPNASETAGNSTPAFTSHVSLELATERLTCENLIHCELRSNSSAGMGGQPTNKASCRFATELAR